MISMKQIFFTVCSWALVCLCQDIRSQLLHGFYINSCRMVEYIELMIQKAQYSYADILAFAARKSIAIASRLALVSLYGISFADILQHV